MRKNTFRHRFMRFASLLAIGGSAFQLTGCDPQVRSTLLAGLQTTSQSLTNALISAFFLTLTDDTATGVSLTTT